MEEASQYPVLFDTLEYRQQNPERVLFPKCQKGGQASILRARSESGMPTVDVRPNRAKPFARRVQFSSVHPRHGMGKAPGRRNPRRARTPIAPEKSGGGRPNRLEDETPEARPSRNKAVTRMLQPDHR